jgi:hypothetical protein
MTSQRYSRSSRTVGIRGYSRRSGRLGPSSCANKAKKPATAWGDSPSIAGTERPSYWSSRGFAREVSSTTKGRQAVATDTSSALSVVSYCTYRVGRCGAEEPRRADCGSH